MPESFTSCSGRMSSPQQASMMAAVIESWPQPAHSVDMRALVLRGGSARARCVGSERVGDLGLVDE